MSTPDAAILSYEGAQAESDRAICQWLRGHIDAALPEATRKVWHGAPVWFLDGNPVVGYWVRKQHVQLLFWSGRSFDEPALRPEGKFQAAELRIRDAAALDEGDLRRWLGKARTIQWDYKNIVKRRGQLERLV
jgi:hypothetical protein